MSHAHRFLAVVIHLVGFVACCSAQLPLLETGFVYATQQTVADKTAATPDEAFDRVVAAAQAKDLAAYCDSMPEPWASAYRRLNSLRNEVGKLHKELLSDLTEKFGQPTDEKKLLFGDSELRMRLEEVRGPFFNPNVELKKATITRQEKQDVDVSLRDLDGVRIDVEESVAIWADATVSNGEEVRKIEQQFVALKIGNEWKVAEAIWFVTPMFEPADDLNAQIDEYKRLLAIYRTALNELNQNLYQARDEVAQVLTAELKDIYGEIKALELEPLLIPEVEVPLEQESLRLRVLARTDEAGRPRVWLEHAEVDLKTATSRLREILEATDGKPPLLILDPDYEAWTSGMPAVLEALLDSGYDRDMIVCNFREDGFTVEDFQKLAKSFKGRLRLFAELPKNSKKFAAIDVEEHLLEIDPLEAADDPTMVDDNPIAEDIDITEIEMVPPVAMAELDLEQPFIEIAPPSNGGTLDVDGGPAEEQNQQKLAGMNPLTRKIVDLTKDEGKVLVVWLIDRSPSMARYSRQVRDRLQKFYHELAIAIDQPGRRSVLQADQKLLSSVMAFGKEVELVTRAPVASRTDVIGSLSRIRFEDSSEELVFTAIHQAADKFRDEVLRNKRRVIIVVFTDEAGDDQERLDHVCRQCERFQIPVYVFGSAAPFGRRARIVPEEMEKGELHQGPETVFLERLYLPFLDGLGDVPLDSGFGPYGLGRLCRETDGDFFRTWDWSKEDLVKQDADASQTLPQAKFDPTIMLRYQPDFVAREEYLSAASKNQSRPALLKAVQASSENSLNLPSLQISAAAEAGFVDSIRESQKKVAVLEQQLSVLYETLNLGVADREKETTPRWQAGFDLAMGRVLAMQARAMTINLKLAEAKAGSMPNKADSWTLVPERLPEDSAAAKLARAATTYLRRVENEHKGTPWAWLAQRELAQPFGWRWQESSQNTNP